MKIDEKFTKIDEFLALIIEFSVKNSKKMLITEKFKLQYKYKFSRNLYKKGSEKTVFF
jgi:hypothetical protein